MNKGYKYRVQLSMVEDNNRNREDLPALIKFGFEDHDDIYRIISFLKENGRFDNKQKIIELPLAQTF